MALQRGKGSTTPRLWTRPLRELTPETSHGFHVIEFAATLLGIILRPWQKWLLIHALELTPDGRYRFRKVVIIVGRQNGKTKLIEVLALWWLFVDSDSFPEHVPADEFLVLGTAQDKDTAKKVWKKVLRRCNPNVTKWPGRFSPAARKAIVPALVAQAMPPSESNGSEAIILQNGAQYQIAASTSGGGRGDSLSRVVLDELREQKHWEGWVLIRGLNGGGGGAVNFVPGNILPVGLRPIADMYLRPLGTTTDQIMIGATGSIGCAGTTNTSTSSDILVMWPTFAAFLASNTYPGVAA